MKTNHRFSIFPKRCAYHAVFFVAGVLLLGMLTTSAQTGAYLYSGSEQTITLGPGLYDITAYGAQGGSGIYGLPFTSVPGGLGAEMEGQFDFVTAVNLTILVGGSGNSVAEGYVGSGGGGGGSFVANGSTPVLIAGGGGGGGESNGGEYDSIGSNGVVSNDGNGGGSGSGLYGGGGGGGFISAGSNGGFMGGLGGSSFLSGGTGGGGGGGGLAGGGGGGGYNGGDGGSGQPSGGGGGGGSYIDSSAIADLTEISGVASPDGSSNGEIIITAVPEPNAFNFLALGVIALFSWRSWQNWGHNILTRRA